jgi:Cullin family
MQPFDMQTAVLMLFNDEETLSFADIKAALGVEDRELRRTLQSLACGKVNVAHLHPEPRPEPHHPPSWLRQVDGVMTHTTFRTHQACQCSAHAGAAPMQVRVLTKEPKGRDVNDFSFNAGFTAQVCMLDVHIVAVAGRCDFAGTVVANAGRSHIQHTWSHTMCRVPLVCLQLYRIKINSIQMRETVEENVKTNEQVLQDRQYQVRAHLLVNVAELRLSFSKGGTRIIEYYCTRLSSA